MKLGEFTAFLSGIGITLLILGCMGLINAIGSIDDNGDVVCPYGCKQCVIPYQYNAIEKRGNQ